MSNVNNLDKTEKTTIFQTILSSPGMNEKCKVNLSMTRQNILLLGRLIEFGLLNDKTHLEDELIASLSVQSVEEFQLIHGDILRKANLTEFYDKLKLLCL